MVALGKRIGGLMGNHEGWMGQVREASERAGESLWPLPLPEEYRKMIDSDVADIKNIGGGRYAGALTAGLFLQEFVGDVPWVHLDIAGPARSDDDEGYLSKGGTGFGVRIDPRSRGRLPFSLKTRRRHRLRGPHDPRSRSRLPNALGHPARRP